jgi:hypothetical protein
MKVSGGVDVQIHVFLTSALVGDEWSVSRPTRFTSEERAPSTHSIGDWMDPRGSLDNTKKRKLSDPTQTQVLTPSVVQPVASHYTN